MLLFRVRPWEYGIESGRKTRIFFLNYFGDFLCMLLILCHLDGW